MDIFKKNIILPTALLISAFCFFGFGMAMADATVTFRTDPLFSATGFLPGNDEDAHIDVTNDAASPRTAYVEAINILNADGVADQMKLEISDGSTEIYHDDLSAFLSAGPIALSSIEAGGSRSYDAKITFLDSAGNEQQGKTVGFDLCVGFSDGSSHCTGDQVASSGGAAPAVSAGSGSTGSGGSAVSVSSFSGPQTPVVGGSAPVSNRISGTGSSPTLIAQGAPIAIATEAVSGANGEAPPLFDVTSEPVQSSGGVSTSFLILLLIAIIVLIALLLYVARRIKAYRTDHIKNEIPH